MHIHKHTHTYIFTVYVMLLFAKRLIRIDFAADDIIVLTGYPDITVI